MLDLPLWLTVALPELSCPHCNNVMRKENVLSVGVRQSTRRKTITVMFFEYECYSCDNRSVVELDKMTLDDFAKCIERGSPLENGSDGAKLELRRIHSEVSSNTNKKRPRKSRRTKKSKITKKEIKEVVKWVETCKTHHDFLLGIGLTEETIEKYSQKRKKDKD